MTNWDKKIEIGLVLSECAAVGRIETGSDNTVERISTDYKILLYLNRNSHLSKPDQRGKKRIVKGVWCL